MSDPTQMYEFAYILDGILSEEKVKDAVRQMTEFIKQNDCKILAVDEEGMKRLGFELYLPPHLAVCVSSFCSILVVSLCFFVGAHHFIVSLPNGREF